MYVYVLFVTASNSATIAAFSARITCSAQCHCCQAIFHASYVTVDLFVLVATSIEMERTIQPTIGFADKRIKSIRKSKYRYILGYTWQTWENRAVIRWVKLFSVFLWSGESMAPGYYPHDHDDDAKHGTPPSHTTRQANQSCFPAKTSERRAPSSVRGTN